MQLAHEVRRLTSSHAPDAVAAHAQLPGPCKPSCCKTPFGHSTARDHLPKWHKDACWCHITQKET